MNTYESLKPPVVVNKNKTISEDQIQQIMRHLRIASGHLISISDLLPLIEKKR